MAFKETVIKNRKKLGIAAAVIVVCTAVVAVYPASAASSGGEQQAVYKETPVQRGDVTVGISESGTATLEAIAITYDDYSSATSSDDNSTVKALVEEVFVKAGQRVSEGDPIAKISTEEIEDSLETQRQSRKEAQIALDKAKLDQQANTITAKNTLDKRISDADNADLNYELALDESDGSLASLKVAMNNAQSNHTSAEEALDEFENLGGQLKSEIASLQAQIAETEAAGGDATSLRESLADKQAELTDYENNYREERQRMYALYSSAANAYNSAKLKYELALGTQSLDESTAETQRTTALSYKDNAQLLYDLEIAQLANTVSSKELALENIDKKIAKLEAYLTDGQVKATCDGLIMNVYVVSGDKVAANYTLASIANSKNVYMSVAIDQEDISTLALGKAANIALDAFPEKKLTGRVDSMSTTPAMGNSSTVSYNIKVRLDNPDESIFEGMTGTVTFVTSEVKDVLTVSSKAVYSENGKSYVKVKGADGTITPVEVETGFTNGTVTEIKSGLNEGDTAIIESKVKSK